MKVLVTGNLGYIGSVLVPLLEERQYEVSGLDSGYFENCNLIPTKSVRNQIIKDIRDISGEDLSGVGAVVHLAGLSNDPLGELAPGLTEEINLEATLRIAKIARSKGVSRFVYASSQSMYGISDNDTELDEYDSNKNPVTSYAKTKWDAEVALAELQTPDFLVCSFRPSTVFGVSPRLRCDIVFNNLVACAFTTGKIEIKSDGTPWRPVVHVRDVCSALIAGIEAPESLVAGRAFNVGIRNGNYTVRMLAEAAQRAIPGSTVVFTGEHGNDSRTYRVSFDRILNELDGYFRPEWNLDRGAAELVDFFRQINFTESDFRGWKTTRLKQLNRLKTDGRLADDLRFIN